MSRTEKNIIENHFEPVFKCATIGIVVTNSSGNIIAANPFALKEFGYTEVELTGHHVEILIPDRYHASHSNHHKNFIAETYTRFMGAGEHLYALRKDGTELPVEISLSSYEYNAEKYVISFITDISARKKTAEIIEKLHEDLELKVTQRTRELSNTLEKLKLVQAFQKAIIDNAGAMIIATDEKGIVNLFNPEASINMGYSEKEVVNKKSSVFFHDKKEISAKRLKLKEEFGIIIKDDFDVLVEKARRDIHTEENYTYIKKNGETLPVSLTITTIYNDEGSILGFMGIALDISERIKAEAELKNVKQLFYQLLKNYPDGAISIIDKEYKFVYTGGDLHSRLNTDIKDLIGNSIYPGFAQPLRKIIIDIIGNVFKTKKPFFDFEFPYPLANSLYMMDAFPLIEEDGSVNKVGTVIQNISVLKKTEEDLRNALEKEKELSELKSRFVSMASHEFRTPLSTVLSSAYLIDKYTTEADQPKREKHLQRIVSSVSMLTDTLNDFLSVGKIEEGKIPVRLSTFNIKEIIEALASEIKNTLKANQKIQYKHEGNMMVTLDVSLMKHIVMNLVSNASKFSPDLRDVYIKTICKDGCLILSVKDKGIGISKEDQVHLMDRFFRGSNAGNIQGTGLGLHIVAKYAELMQGEVTCKSELEAGTEFIITFKNQTGQYEENITN
ncbi:MAG: PAS domain-containing sensor histidine kinase [Ferruginibacter sp.]